MVLVNLFGRQFQIVNGAGTTPDGSFALRKAPPWAGASSAEELVAAMSNPQLDALTTMASWAESNLNNVTGTTTLNGKRVPKAAAEMYREWNNADFGGMSKQELRQQRKASRIDIADIEQEMRATPGTQ